MRLGRSESVLFEGTKLSEIYNSLSIYERHRHRYEVSNAYRDRLVEAGLVVAGVTPDGALVESVQWPDHSWGIGVQFHPEFRSRPTAAHPLFQSFVAAALRRQRAARSESEVGAHA